MIPFAWHRLIVPLADGWSPIKLAGDERQGLAEFADLRRPRLAVRWQTLRAAPKDPDAILQKALRAELGRAALEQATTPGVLPTAASHALVYEDVDSHKRHMGVAYFPASRRLVQLLYPLDGADDFFHADLFPNLAEVPPAGEAPWAVFELTCLTSPELRLDHHRLNAGDLSLFFVGRRRWGALRSWAGVRQMAVGALALKKMPLASWLRTLQKPDLRFYRPSRKPEETELSVAGQTYPGLRFTMPRRRRYAFLRMIPRACVTLGCHDTKRDRLVLLHGTDEDTLRELAASVGAPLVPADPVR